MSPSRPPRDTDWKCRQCDESRPEAMTKRGLCYECMLIDQGHTPTERHHPFGRNNSIAAEIAVAIPGNWHRALDDRRAQRPKILKRPGDNPLHQIAAIATTLGEAAEAFADYARREQWPEWAARLADLLSSAAHCAANQVLVLAGHLDKRFGAEWTRDLELPPWDF
jgi:hypothetical protein